MDEPLKQAIETVGGVRELSRILRISHQSITNWRRVPPLRVITIEKLTGIPRHTLRPDIYPPN